MDERSITEREAISKAFNWDELAHDAFVRGDLDIQKECEARAKEIRRAISVLFPDITY